MSTYMAAFESRDAGRLLGLSVSWARVGCALFRKWMPKVGGVVLALAMIGTVTALAAGSVQAPELPIAASPLPTPGFYYTVRPGDTLYSIARRFGTTVQAIVQANGLVNPNQIFSGQVFWIPSSGGGWTGSTAYTVRRGDTLYSIARRYGTTYQALAAANGLRSPYTIYVGQRLVISRSGTPWPGPSTSKVHIVRAGETLWSIALRYGTSTWAIAVANGLWNTNLIYVGQRLLIP